MTTSRIRTPAVFFLALAAMVTSLALGGAFIVLNRMKNPAETAVVPLTDDQARQQVLGPAREFVDAGGLQAVSATYILASCQVTDEPPYQGTVYLSFGLPSVAETPAYFRGVAGAMRARGWAEGLPPNRHPGGKILSRDGVRALIYRSPDVAGRGVLELSGECRNLSSAGDTGFVDVTAEVDG